MTAVVRPLATASSPLEAMTAALVESNDRLGALLRLTEAHSGSLDETGSLESLLEAAIRLTSSDGGRIVASREYQRGTPAGPDHQRITRTRKVSDDLTLDVELWRPEPYRTPDQKLLAGVANLAASAVRTGLLHREAVAHQLTLQEHSTAAQLVTSALPDGDRPPAIAEMTAFAVSVPAREAGGDLFTWLERDGDLWFAVGDVSGKGLPAAVQMATTVTAIESAIRHDDSADPTAVIAAVQRWMHDRLSDAGMFVTLIVGRWQPVTRQLDMANAGHSPVAFVVDGELQRVEATAPPIGVLEDCLPEPLTFTDVPRGATLALGSDGLTEQVNPDGAMFGEGRLDQEVCRAAGAHDSAASIASDILGCVDRHSQGMENGDDRTLMVLRFGAADG